MADPYGPMRQAARSVLRSTDEYREAVRLGVARRWLAREGDQLVERLMDEAWKWTPRPMQGEDR